MHFPGRLYFFLIFNINVIIDFCNEFIEEQQRKSKSFVFQRTA